MQYEDDLRVGLRHRLRAAIRDHDRIAIAALREAIAALDNAEAVPIDTDLNAQAGQYIAGGVVGLGAGEAEPDTRRRSAADNRHNDHRRQARRSEHVRGAGTDGTRCSPSLGC